MKNWSKSTKVTVALCALLVVWLVARAIGYGRMAHALAHQTATPHTVAAARKLILQKKLARVFKDGTDHAKFQAVRTSQAFAADLTTVEIEDHHMSMAEAAAGAMVEFLSDLELPVRAAAADALGRMGKPAARPLIDVALTSPDKDVRSNATKALTAIGEVAVPELIEAVKGGKPTQKIGAATALGELHTPRAIPALIGALSVKEGEVRLTCRDSLVELGQATVAPLIGALGDKSPLTRRHSAEALGELGDRAAAPPLLALFADDHRQVRLAAVYAVGKVGDPIATLPLIAKMADQDREIREGAAVSLGQAGDARAVPVLVAALEDPVEAVREQAAASLGRLKPADPVVLAQIATIAGLPSVGTRLAAVKALGLIANPVSVPAVIGRLSPVTESNAKVRRRSAEALGLIASPAAVPALIEAFGDQDWRVNYAAQVSLTTIGAPAVPALVQVLGSPDPLKARYARKALTNMTPPPLAALTAAARTGTAEQRTAAALGLGDIGTAEAREVLTAIAGSDPDARVKFAADHALAGHVVRDSAPAPAPAQPATAEPDAESPAATPAE